MNHSEKKINVEKLRSLAKFSESNNSPTIVPTEMFTFFIAYAQNSGPQQIKQIVGQEIGLNLFTDKFLLNIPMFSSFISMPVDKVRSFFQSNFFRSTSLSQMDIMKLVQSYFILPTQVDWRLYDYPSHELIDDLIQILFTLKAPTYAYLFDQKLHEKFTRKKVLSTCHYLSISIDPTEKMERHDYTLDEILSQTAAKNPKKDNKCWLLTQ